MQVPPPPPPSNFYVRKCPDVQCFTPVGHPSTYLTLSTIRANITNYFFRLSSDDIISFKSQCRLKDASSCVSTFTVLENTPPNRRYVVISFYKTYITKGKSHASRCRGSNNGLSTDWIELLVVLKHKSLKPSQFQKREGPKQTQPFLITST